MGSLTFTASVALWLVFLASSSAYEVTPTSSSYGVTPTPLPYWRNPYYFRPTSPSYSITPSPLPYWRNPYYLRPTEQPYRWRNGWEPTSPSYYIIPISPSYRVIPTPTPYWRNPYYIRPTPLPYWKNPYYLRPTPLPYWKDPYYIRPTTLPYWKNPYYFRPNAPDPSVEVYQQVENSENLIVVCQFGTKTVMSSFHLSVKNGDGNYMLNNPACIAETMCVFNVTATPPVSFTCVHIVNAGRDLQTLLSEVYVHQPQNVSKQLKPQVSTFYIVFASFFGVGLVIMVAMVVATTIITRYKGPRWEVKENVYADTEII